MGWWSATILGGDSALDALGALAKACEVPLRMKRGRERTLSGYAFTRARVERNLAAMRAVVERPADPQRRAIAGQVLGVIVLFVGADVPPEVIALATACAQDDAWMREEGTRSARGRHIAELLAALAAHQPGHRTELEEEGLIAKVSRASGRR